MTSGKDDRRSQRTRKALLDAFGKLAVVRNYDELRVIDILELANVGRSTFYEHFRNKDDLLRQSLSGLLSVLANTVDSADDSPHLERVLEHFWENRRLARGLLRGSAAPHVLRVLREFIEERLSRKRRQEGPLQLPLHLLATQLAAAELGLLQAWLLEEARCTPATLARALRSGSLGLIAGLHATSVARAGYAPAPSVEPRPVESR